nr:hypothetical protein [Candidatus Enterovibrio escacola]
MDNLDVIFVDVDDFYQTFLPAWEKHLISSGVKEISLFAFPLAK